MSFSPDWLALREPLDLAARDRDLRRRAAAIAGPNAVVLDLGSGTGSTARAFDMDICTSWRWRFVDGDAALLKIAKTKHVGAECFIMNLRDIAALPLDGVSLVTASALLDLMPEAWMISLAERLQDASVPLYAALNYDGRMSWYPEIDCDADITASFNLHQRTDKGIGPAMGPHSGTRAAQILTEYGFDVILSKSPWQLGAEDVALHTQLIAGIGQAADEIGNPLALRWTKDRQASVAQSTGTIGHTDLFAVPQNSMAQEIIPCSS